jgi:hypothetical protein
MGKGFTVTVKGGRTLWCDDYECQECGKYWEITTGRDEAVPLCECGGKLEVVITKPKDWEFKVTKGDDRIIWSDKQIEASHGKNWRETSARPRREGGCGGRQFYDRGASRYRPVGAE